MKTKKIYIAPSAELIRFNANNILVTLSKTNIPADKGNGQLSKESQFSFNSWDEDNDD